MPPEIRVQGQRLRRRTSRGIRSLAADIMLDIKGSDFSGILVWGTNLVPIFNA